MDRQALEARLLTMVTTAATLATPLGLIPKVMAIVNQIITFLWGLPKEDVDYLLDLVEANNSKNSTVMVAMKIVRMILRCPDEIEETDQTKPI